MFQALCYVIRIEHYKQKQPNKQTKCSYLFQFCSLFNLWTGDCQREANKGDLEKGMKMEGI